MENKRVYAILQANADNSVELVSCFTNYEDALKKCRQLNKIYSQSYYINDCLLDFDYQGELK
jgi:hypothetical protein